MKRRGRIQASETMCGLVFGPLWVRPIRRPCLAFGLLFGLQASTCAVRFEGGRVEHDRPLACLHRPAPSRLRRRPTGHPTTASDSSGYCAVHTLKVHHTMRFRTCSSPTYSVRWQIEKWAADDTSVRQLARRSCFSSPSLRFGSMNHVAAAADSRRSMDPDPA